MLSGLFGTVTGLIKSFGAVSEPSPSTRPRRRRILAEGISEAMNCTAFGLVVAIVGLIGFAVLNGKTQGIEDDINEASVQVLNLVVQQPPEGERVARFRPREITPPRGRGGTGVSPRSTVRDERRCVSRDRWGDGLGASHRALGSRTAKRRAFGGWIRQRRNEVMGGVDVGERREGKRRDEQLRSTWSRSSTC
ncbi:MAG: MotA/TolQ/ExbB proton channel family protein [Cypionkella sp.]